MARKIPRHIVQIYGSARAFKAAKRYEIRRLQYYLQDLRRGCAFLPCGTGPVDRIAEELAAMRRACGAKEWGR
jgi:hypothetical protein